MSDRFLGWTDEQLAYAKQRHKMHGNGELKADLSGIMALRQWWHSHAWMDPLSIRIEGVTLESDSTWAAKATAEAMQTVFSKGLSR
jgi:hypothetical protein